MTSNSTVFGYNWREHPKCLFTAVGNERKKHLRRQEKNKVNGQGCKIMWLFVSTTTNVPAVVVHTWAHNWQQHIYIYIISGYSRHMHPPQRCDCPSHSRQLLKLDRRIFVVVVDICPEYPPMIIYICCVLCGQTTGSPMYMHIIISRYSGYIHPPQRCDFPSQQAAPSNWTVASLWWWWMCVHNIH